jgi:hypothetical protein
MLISIRFYCKLLSTTIQWSNNQVKAYPSLRILNISTVNMSRTF